MGEPEIQKIVPGNMFGEAKTQFQLNSTKAVQKPVNAQFSPASTKAKTKAKSGRKCM